MGFWFGFDTGFDIMQVFVFAIFAIVIVCFIALAVKGIGTWHKNNNSPRLTVQAAVVAKRQNTDVHHHSNNNGGMHTSTSTHYYVTFQFDSGDRLELPVTWALTGTPQGPFPRPDPSQQRMSRRGTRRRKAGIRSCKRVGYI